MVLSKAKKDKFVTIRNADEANLQPLVLLVSWSNATERQLLKYSAIYEKNGMTVMLILCKLLRATVFHDSLFIADVQKVREAISSEVCRNHSRSVFFHLFSKPGPAMLIDLLSCYYPYINVPFYQSKRFDMKPGEVKPNIVGVVYDSCMINHTSPRQFGNGTKSMTKNPVAKPIYYCFGNLMRHFCNNIPAIRVWEEINRNVPGGYPQLVLFSKQDSLVYYEKTLKFIEYRKNIGQDISFRLWDDSAHVLLLKDHNDEYTRLVNDFIKKSLVKQNPPKQFWKIELEKADVSYENDDKKLR